MPKIDKINFKHENIPKIDQKNGKKLSVLSFLTKLGSIIQNITKQLYKSTTLTPKLVLNKVCMVLTTLAMP